MRTFMILLYFLSSSFASSTTDCTAVFEERKAELIREIEKIDEARQVAQAIKAANDSLYEKKMKALKKEQAKNQELLRQIKEESDKLSKMNKKKEELIASIKDIKNNKLSQTYGKMKETPAASILENMTREEAADILFNLSPKKVSKIMAKMQPSIASEITVLLTKGPPFVTVKNAKKSDE